MRAATSGKRRFPVWELVRWIVFTDPADTKHGSSASHLAALLVIVLVSLINATLQDRGLYDAWEWTDFDALQRASATFKPTDMKVVLIGEDEYRDLFNSTSPLKPEVVARLVKAICDFHPRVVAIDLLTERWSETDRQMLEEVRRSNCPVIWAHDSIDVRSSTASEGLAAQRLGLVLGQEITPDWTCSALPIVVAGSDGVVRQYSESYPIRNEAAGAHADRFEPTLPAALHAAWNRGPKQCVGQQHEPTQEFTLEKIRFTHHRGIYKLPAAMVLGAAPSGGHPEFFPIVNANLRDKAVVLGAGYRHARDTHPTPVGALTGAEVLANAALTVADPIPEIKPRVSFVLDVSIGIGLFFLVHAMGLRSALTVLVSAVAAGLAAFGISWMFFKYLGFFLGVFASLGGIVIGSVVDLTWEHLGDDFKDWWTRLREKIDELRREASATEGAGR